MLRKLKKKINKTLFDNRVTNPEFLVFFRIAIGTLLLFHFLAILKDFDILFGMNALIPSDIHTVYSDDFILFYPEIISFLTSIGLSESLAVISFQIAFVILCLTIIVGFYSRIGAFLLLILQISLIKSAGYFTYGVDFFSSMSLMYLIIMPSDHYYSVRQYFRPFRSSEDLTVFRRLLQYHMCFAYGVSGFEKLLGFNWRNGESIWKAIHLPNFHNDFNLDFNFLGEFPWLLILLGWGTIIIELCYPIFITIKKTRMLWLGLTISLHLGIALCLNLYFFSSIMIIWNLTNYYFLDTKREVLGNLKKELVYV